MPCICMRAGSTRTHVRQGRPASVGGRQSRRTAVRCEPHKELPEPNYGSTVMIEQERCTVCRSRALSGNHLRFTSCLQDHIFVGCNGHVLCLNSRDGNTLWRRYLEAGCFPGHLFPLDEKLFIRCFRQVWYLFWSWKMAWYPVPQQPSPFS